MFNERVLVVVEGSTENIVLRKLVAPHLGAKGVFIYPKIIGESNGKGGSITFNRLVSDMVNLHLQEPGVIVTSFVDYYGRQGTWPSEAEGKAKGLSAAAMAAILETDLKAAITAHPRLSGARLRLLPYIQVHELEALLYAQPELLAGEVFGEAEKAGLLRADLEGLAHCELLNDSKETAPSRRLENHFGVYQKGRGNTSHARLFAEKAELATIRQVCPRFDTWVRALENPAAI
jgi:hypothetical protein